MNDVYAAVESIDLGLNSSSMVFPHSSSYQNSVTGGLVGAELMRNMAMAMAAIFICTLFLLADIVGSLIDAPLLAKIQSEGKFGTGLQDQLEL